MRVCVCKELIAHFLYVNNTGLGVVTTQEDVLNHCEKPAPTSAVWNTMDFILEG